MPNRDGPVYQDYKSFRDFDAGEQTQRHMLKGIIISLLGVLTPLAAVAYFTSTNPLALLYLELLLGMVVMGPIIFYFMGRNDTKMNMAHHGYNIDWEPQRQKFFGRDTYHILRADPGTGQAAIIGFNHNPFSVSKRQIQKIEKKQRDDAECEICRHTLFEKRMLDTDGAYFVEERKRYWIFGVPIKEKILGWDAYCPEHKPKPSEYN